MNFKIFLILTLISIVAISGCIGQQEEQPKFSNNLTIDGVDYVFQNNIYDTLNTSLEDGDKIQMTLESPERIIIAYNGSSGEDNKYFTVVSFNLVEKLKNYYVYSKGRIQNFQAIDLNEVSQVPPGSTVILLRGPNTGAGASNVYYDGECVYNGRVIAPFSRCINVQGKDYAGLVKSSERLILFVIGFTG